MQYRPLPKLLFPRNVALWARYMSNLSNNADAVTRFALCDIDEDLLESTLKYFSVENTVQEAGL